jgi:Fic family protein
VVDLTRVGARARRWLGRGGRRGRVQADDGPCRHAAQGDLDGRGNLSQHTLVEFILWFLRVCLDQVEFVSRLFELDALVERLRTYVARRDLKPEAGRLLEEALIRGEFERGEIARITGLPDRSARRVFSDLIGTGLLASATPKGAVSLRFPVDALETLFPRLFPES